MFAALNVGMFEAHNRLAAENIFGVEFMSKKIYS
jgi:hypothetical protein